MQESKTNYSERIWSIELNYYNIEKENSWYLALNFA